MRMRWCVWRLWLSDCGDCVLSCFSTQFSHFSSWRKEALSPDKGGRCADQCQVPLMTGSPGQPSRHTRGSSSPCTGHTAAKTDTEQNSPEDAIVNLSQLVWELSFTLDDLWGFSFITTRFPVLHIGLRLNQLTQRSKITSFFPKVLYSRATYLQPLNTLVPEQWCRLLTRFKIKTSSQSSLTCWCAPSV